MPGMEQVFTETMVGCKHDDEDSFKLIPYTHAEDIKEIMVSP